MKIFDQVQLRKPARNVFNLSHEVKLTGRTGFLMPILVQECLPGDVFRFSLQSLLRAAPLLAPLMHRVHVDFHAFEVANRLTWDNGPNDCWETFMTGGENGLAAPTVPVIQVNEANRAKYAPMALYDYLGMPTIDDSYPPITTPTNWSALPARAYYMVYNEYFRNQNVQPALAYSKAGGVDGTDYSLQFRNLEKDYFTSALPFAQRGAPVNVPFTADVIYKDVSEFVNEDGSAPGASTSLDSDNDSELKITTAGGAEKGRIENIDEIVSSGFTVSDLRRSIRLQEYLEKNAVGGARYTEQLLVRWYVKSPDARMQRPIFLGGMRTPLRISEVLSTYQAEDSTSPNALPQGNMSGHGISIGKSSWNHRTVEHSYIIVMMSIIPKTGYMNGIPRHLTRFSRLEYASPEFAQIGEQSILNQELFWQPNDPGGDDGNGGSFGYQSRYAEYKYGISRVHGLFRTSLDFWISDRMFDTLPTLSADFVSSTAEDLYRNFAVTDREYEQFYINIFFSIKVVRSLPYFGTPTI